MDDNWDKLRDLHLTYRAGKLRVLVGAGISAGSHFPTWGRLVDTLLQHVLKVRHRELERIEPKEMRKLVDSISESIGRLGGAELVYEAVGEVHFRKFLADSLYTSTSEDNPKKRSIREIPVTTVQRYMSTVLRHLKA
jgi:hypothetical protein